eukprot:351059-Chlamydomonas_euryale.AAC.2
MAGCADVWRVQMFGVCRCLACADVWRVQMFDVCRCLAVLGAAVNSGVKCGGPPKIVCSDRPAGADADILRLRTGKPERFLPPGGEHRAWFFGEAQDWWGGV